MPMELVMVEQRYRTVLEVLEDGVPVTEVARRYGWRGRRCTSGWPAMRTAGSGARRWPSRTLWELERAGVMPLPGRSAVYRALIRHGLVIARLSPRAATGSPSTGRRRWMITQAATPMPAVIRYMAVTHTATRAGRGAWPCLAGASGQDGPCWLIPVMLG
ncbi:MAG TPA: hypothetical protein VF070_47775 [Streptosporangiaceae bacterium]